MDYGQGNAFFFSSRRRHTRWNCDWSSDVCSSDLGPVYTYAQLFADPQVGHRGLVVHADDAELGRVPHIRTPIKMSSASVAVRAVAPKRSEERRVGKECRWRGAAEHVKKRITAEEV